MAIDRAVKRCNPCLLLVGMIFALFVLLAFCTRDTRAADANKPSSDLPEDNVVFAVPPCVGEGAQGCTYQLSYPPTLNAKPPTGICRAIISVTPNGPTSFGFQLIIDNWLPGQTYWFAQNNYDLVGFTCDSNGSGGVIPYQRGV